MQIRRTLKIADDLVYKNNPSTIIILDSRNKGVDIEYLDQMHQGLGMKMFGYHYMIYRDGNIYAGRPENAYPCDIEVVTQKIDINQSPFDENEDIEVESASKVVSAGRIFICLEGNTEVNDITSMQRSSLIELAKDVKSRNRNMRGIYSLSEIIPSIDNLGPFVDMNSIRAEINSTVVPVYISTPAGGISYSYGKRILYYNSGDPISGNDVRLVQLYLKLLNIPVNDSVGGVYNYSTEKAVKEFQKMFSLDVTGTMRDEEYKLLERKIMELSKVVDYSQYHRFLFYRKDNMMTGKDVENVQSKLARLRYMEYTGIFDKQMEDGVKDFQYDNRLTSTGKIGPITWRNIMDTIGIDYVRRLVYDENILMSGEDIKFIQKKISHMAKKFGIVVVTTNGVYDEITYNNVRKIQSQINFPITGEVDEKMFEYLANS